MRRFEKSFKFCASSEQRERVIRPLLRQLWRLECFERTARKEEDQRDRLCGFLLNMDICQFLPQLKSEKFGRNFSFYVFYFSFMDDGVYLVSASFFLVFTIEPLAGLPIGRIPFANLIHPPKINVFLTCILQCRWFFF